MTLASSAAGAAPALAVVRPMTVDDLGFAAGLHEAALSHGFFGRLGTTFLAAYYESFLASPHAVALVVEEADEPVGALVGTFGPHYAWVLRRRWRALALRGVAALMARPAELSFFLRTRVGRYLRKLAGARQQALSPVRPATVRRELPPAVLTHVAVVPAARGTGAGAALVRAFEDRARTAGARETCLVTLAGPQGAGPFYRRLGWSLSSVREDRDGRPIETYRRRL